MTNNTIADNFWDDQEPPKKEYFWQHFEDQQVFCGFDVVNDNKRPMGMDRMMGISADASIERLGTYQQAKALGYPYVGISLFKPVMIGDLYLVCIDLDAYGINQQCVRQRLHGGTERGREEQVLSLER